MGKVGEAGFVIDHDELRAAFQATAAEMPGGLELIGVTFQPGADHDWVAFAQSHADPDVGCEGWGDTPIAALADLLSHAFVLDTMVTHDARHFGIGTRLVEVAAEQARIAGCEWLHVDFDDELAAFYFEGCGFTPTPAGVIALR